MPSDAGHAYENLGLEALYKPGRGMIGCNFILISDASSPLPDGKTHSLTSMLAGNLTTPRLFDIASDQIRGLRSRTFIDAVRSGAISGALIRMGNPVDYIDRKVRRERPTSEYQHFQSVAEAAIAHRHPTTWER